MEARPETSDLLVFSHLRWDFICQRPQQVMLRMARHRRVFYVEDPICGMTEAPQLQWKETPEGVQVVTPHFPEHLAADALERELAAMLQELILEEGIYAYTLWYYTPLALPYTRDLVPAKTIYDCMDELSLFKETPGPVVALDRELFERADLVFAVGQSLYHAKKSEHANLHLMPNHIDGEHFSQARSQLVEPDDQINIPHPRVGFYGVVDDRIDFELLETLADLRPEFQFVLVGPVLLTEALPLRPNIHYLGKKDYHILPLYISGWDAAFLPYRPQDSSWHMFAEKTLELLTAGRPVVATPLTEIIYPFAGARLVHIADAPLRFAAALEAAMNERAFDSEWAERVDAYLADNSWDAITERMHKLESQILVKKASDEFMHMGCPVTL